MRMDLVRGIMLTAGLVLAAACSDDADPVGPSADPFDTRDLEFAAAKLKLSGHGTMVWDGCIGGCEVDPEDHEGPILHFETRIRAHVQGNGQPRGTFTVNMEFQNICDGPCPEEGGPGLDAAFVAQVTCLDIVDGRGWVEGTVSYVEADEPLNFVIPLGTEFLMMIEDNSDDSPASEDRLAGFFLEAFPPGTTCHNPPDLYEDGGAFTPVDLLTGDFVVKPGPGSTPVF